jgi:tetratricopeptide (TPR) repeat protein
MNAPLPCRYNGVVVRRAVCLLAVSLFLCAALHAQQNPAWGHTLVVIPFENTSPTPGLEWLGEGFAAALRAQLDSPLLYVATREERLRAYDRQGIPAGLHPSRATLYRLAEQMDLDYAVLGSYRFDGENLTATAQLLDMRAPRLLPIATEAGRLTEVGNLQSALAWDVLRLMRADFALPKDKYIASVPAMRLDAWDSYIHGLLAAAAEEKVRHFREAVRLNPSFAEAWLELGKAYFEQKSFESAASAFEKVPPSSAVAREANFYLGLSGCAHGDYETAERAFEFVAARLPLAEVYNNLGVVAARRGQKRAVIDFERAVENDPSDPDYRFNLALALNRAGDRPRATRELRAALERRPDDAEVKAELNSLTSPAGSVVNSAAISKPPPERLKRGYQENAFRQMTMQMQSWAERQFARSDPRSHARYHLELGTELLAHGFVTEAEAEFRHAATVNPASPAPLAALAEVYEARSDSSQARAQAEASLRVGESVEAYLVLTRLDLGEGRTDAAGQSINRALQLEPANPAAQDLKRTLAAKLAEKGQP